MSQRSITSFFGAKPSVKPEKDAKGDKVSEKGKDKDYESPVKTSKRVKRARIESDSDDSVSGAKGSPPKKRLSSPKEYLAKAAQKQVSNGRNRTYSESTDPESDQESNRSSSTPSSPVKQVEKSPTKSKTAKGKGSPKQELSTKDKLSQFFFVPKHKAAASEKSTKEEKDDSEKEVEEKDEGSSKEEEEIKEEQMEVSVKEDVEVEEKENVKKEAGERAKKKEDETQSGKKKREVKRKNKTKEASSAKKVKPKMEMEEEEEEKEKKDEEEKDEGKKKEDTDKKEVKKETKKVSGPLAAMWGPKAGSSGTEEKDGSLVAGHEYDPSKLKYHPLKDACWKEGEKVPYLALARSLEAIEGLSSRLRTVETLANYLRSVILLSPDDFLPSIYLCLNRLAPAYEGLELGIAETTLMKAIAQSTGRTLAQVKADAGSTGDLGLVAEQSRSAQRMMFRPAPLTVAGVFSKLKDIAQMTGKEAMSKKADKIQTLLVACRHSEARFLTRSLAGKLRVGLAEQSVLQAIGQACAMTPPEQSGTVNACSKMTPEQLKACVDETALIVKTTYCECPNYNLIIPVVLEEGVAALPEKCRLTPGIPLKPMLAHPTKGVQEVLTRFEGLAFTCEWKYDGERAQIHCAEDGTVSIFSRNQENNTSKYPDIIASLPKAKGPEVKSCILDTEAVAWDRQKNQILPFQVLSTRKRKDASEDDIKVRVCVFMFDLLYLNGESLVRQTLAERRELLKKHFNAVDGDFAFASSVDVQSMEEVQEFLEVSVKGNCEGLMVKTLEQDATYEIAKRSRNWLKLKKDYLDGVGDTLDVVVLGGYLGKGKRTGVYGGFLIGCYDQQGEEYQSLCKLGTGFSEESLQKHSDFFKDHILDAPRPYYRYDSSLAPDQWFDVVQVWEIKCADLSLSPVHKAAQGLVDPEKGISLRFPRFLRIRDDKTPEEATSAEQIAEMYRSQEQVKNQEGGRKANEEDFY